jgi:hypothetical protein
MTELTITRAMKRRDKATSSSSFFCEMILLNAVTVSEYRPSFRIRKILKSLRILRNLRSTGMRNGR